MFSPKEATESQYSQDASKGIVIRRRDTTPVPIVTENQDGEKLRTTRRQPTSYLVSFTLTSELDAREACDLEDAGDVNILQGGLALDLDRIYATKWQQTSKILTSLSGGCASSDMTRKRCRPSPSRVARILVKSCASRAIFRTCAYQQSKVRW